MQAVCVYCASSDGIDPVHRAAAERLGALLADGGLTVVYGGGRMGAMGALAEGALARGGKVVGVMPDFLTRLELAHTALTELHVVQDMRTRKHEMLARSDAVIALPGGCGTFEELLEAITLRKLGVHDHTIVIVNTADYYAPLLEQLRRAQSDGFLAASATCWQVAATVEEAVAIVQQVAA